MVRNKRSLWLNNCEGNVMLVRQDFSGSADNERNVVACSVLICANNFKDSRVSPVIHLIPRHCNILVSQLDRKSHNWIVWREISYVITVCVAVENLILFSLQKIFVGKCYNTPTNHSHDTSRHWLKPTFWSTHFYGILSIIWKTLFSQNSNLRQRAIRHHRMCAMGSTTVVIGRMKSFA